MVVFRVRAEARPTNLDTIFDNVKTVQPKPSRPVLDPNQ